VLPMISTGYSNIKGLDVLNYNELCRIIKRKCIQYASKILCSIL